MKTKLFLVSLITVLFFTACNKGGNTGLLVPADAGLVTHIDLNSLSSKLSWDEIKATAWFAEAQKEIKDSLFKQLLNNPNESGVNTKGSIVFFFKMNTDGGGYAVVETDVQDAKKLSDVITKAGEGKISVQKDGEYHFVDANGKAVVYFNDKKLIVVSGSSNFSGLANQGSNKEYPIDSLKNYAKKIFTLKGKDLLDSDERFSKLITDKSDMHYWANAGNMYHGMLSGMAAMMKLDVFLKGAVSTASINFDNGKITLNSIQHYGKEMTDFYKKYDGKTISNEALQKLPNGDALFAMAAGFNPEGIKEFTKLIGVDGLMNMGLGQVGISADDFVKANKGQLVMALTDLGFSNEKKSVDLGNGEKYEYIDNKPNPQFVLGMQVGDKAAFQKLIDAVTKYFTVVDDTSKNNGMPQLQVSDKWFALSNDKSTSETFVNGNSSNTQGYSNYLKGNNMGLYFNIQSIIESTTKSSKDTALTQAATISKNFWRVAGLSGNLKNGKWISKGEIILADANTNSLKQLNKYIDEMVQIGIQENKKRKANNDIEFTAPIIAEDTAVLAPVH